MNITKLFNLLKEDMEINKFNKAVEGKVSPEILNAFASRMKKGKYNNISLAILKGIQAADERHRAVLEKDYAKAYAVLRQMAKGNSSFNAGEIINEYLGSNNPETFWRDKYTENKAEKPADPNFGLKDARVKETKNFYLIFPRTFYKDYHLFTKEDMEKGWQELKAISDEMAKKDTSGEYGANVNHWCVAASRPTYYIDYKKDGGVFVVIVKKNEDGSPDWNERWLWYCNSQGENAQLENKLDRSTDNSTVYKDKEVASILDKIKRSFKSKLRMIKNDDDTVTLKTIRHRQTRQKEQEKEVISKAGENIIHPSTKKQRDNLHLYQIARNIRKISKFIFENKDSLSYQIKFFIIKKYLNGRNIIDAIRNDASPDNPFEYEKLSSKERFTIRPVQKLKIKGLNTSRFPFILVLEKGKSDKSGYSLYFADTGYSFRESWILLAKTKTPDKESAQKQFLETFEKLTEKNKSENPPEYGTAGKVDSLSLYYSVIKDNPNYNSLNNNKYAEDFIKKVAEDKNKRRDYLFYKTLYPYYTIVVYGNKTHVGYSNEEKEFDTDDPELLDKIKQNYKDYISKLLPGFTPKF